MGVKAWITVNGQHIPIMDGESKMQAVGRFIKGKRKDKKDKVVKSYMEDHENKSKEYAEGLYDDTRKKFGLQRTIKGRAKTPQEYREDAHKYISGKAIKYNREGMTPRKAVEKATLEYAKQEDAKKSNSKSFNYFRGEYINPKSYKLKEDKPKRAAKGELTEKKLYLDYKNNYTTDELKAYKRQLDNHYRQFKNSNKYGDDITARNYRAIITVLAERRKRK